MIFRSLVYSFVIERVQHYAAPQGRSKGSAHCPFTHLCRCFNYQRQNKLMQQYGLIDYRSPYCCSSSNTLVLSTT